MDKKYLIILIIIGIACFSIFFYQFTNSVDTFIVINETEVAENGTISGFLMDAYARGVENKTIYYHKAGDNKNTLSNVTTGKDGSFKIENVKYVPESNDNNYYGDITFKGEGEFNPCIYEHNITIKHS
jgi:hypothetical protein